MRAGTGAFSAPRSDLHLQGATGVLLSGGFRFFASDSHQVFFVKSAQSQYRCKTPYKANPLPENPDVISYRTLKYRLCQQLDSELPRLVWDEYFLQDLLVRALALILLVLHRLFVFDGERKPILKPAHVILEVDTIEKAQLFDPA